MVSKKSKKRSFFQWVLIILTILSVLCLLLSYAAFFVSPAKLWFLAFFGLAYPLILAVNLFFVIVVAYPEEKVYLDSFDRNINRVQPCTLHYRDQVK